MKNGMKLACLALLGCATVGMWAQADTDGSAPPPDKSAAPVVQPPGAEVPSDYIIGADDTLHISVWNEAQLNATLPVRPDGKISLPLLDDVQAAGLTPVQLKNSIKEKLKKYIGDPRVTVVVTAMNSQRIYVLGEVLHTGAMPLLPHMTMLQALSSAGFTQFANLKAVYLLRTQGGQQTKIRFNYKDALKGKDTQQNIVLRPGDTIVVP
ncbi:MAG: polysaccharide biosynthesis/export family protein [Candidatus Sulfotelmatobacter sp.]